MISSFARVVGVLALAVACSVLFVEPTPTVLIATPWSAQNSVAAVDNAPSTVPPTTDAVTTRVPENTAPAQLSGMRIAIPRLGIDLPLEPGDLGRDTPRAGFAGATPENAALLYPGTSVPGTGGNSYVYAHARQGMFLALWSVRLDDAVVVLRKDGSVLKTYRVKVIVARVDPADAHWLDPGGAERLTLQTSTGPRPEDPRFIAVAYPDDPTSAAH